MWQKCKNLKSFDLSFSEFGAGNEARTRDPDLGKVVLYQLSYSRINHTCFRNKAVLYEKIY